MSDDDSTSTTEPVSRLDLKKAFDDWLDNTYGLIEILGGVYLPSEALPKLDLELYEISLGDFIESGGAAPLDRSFPLPSADTVKVGEGNSAPDPFATTASQPSASSVIIAPAPSPDPVDVLESIVLERFPTPVAYNFRRFEVGSQELSQKLYFLRDTWESLVYLLYAIVVGEFRCSGGSLATTKFTLDHLLSSGMNDKLDIIKKILKIAGANGPNLLCASFVTESVIQHLDKLNKERNDFSHSSTPSLKQIQRKIENYTNPVLSILQETMGLQNVRLLRYTGSGTIYTLNHQLFMGHNTDHAFATMTITAAQSSTFKPYMTANDKILAYLGDRLFSVAPFVHYVEDDSGHYTKLCFYKKRGKESDGNKGKLVYEIIGEAQPIEEDESFFQEEIDDLCSRLAPPKQTSLSSSGAGQS